MVDYNKVVQKVKEEVDEVKKSPSIEALKLIDRKVLIIGGIVVFILLCVFYYFLFFVAYPYKLKDRGYNYDKAQTQEAIKKEATSQLYSSMPASSKTNLPNTATPKAADLYKIPANYMDVSVIPAYETSNYVTVFDITYDFFKDVNKGNYQNALLYLNKDFVNSNRITADLLSKYFKETYFQNNGFIINKISKAGNNYNVQLIVTNQDITGVSFNINYIITDHDGKLDISINDLANYIKDSTRYGNKN